MIYFCADDFGFSDTSSMHIQELIDCGRLDKVSVFPNIGEPDLQKMCENKKVRIALHLNLVEGKCMADAGKLKLIADKNGNLKHTFEGLLLESMLHKKEFEAEVYDEIKAQISFWKSILPPDMPFCIDSHQHTHMIPSVFRMLLAALKDENVTLRHMRIPVEPLTPFIKNPSLYFTYSGINVIKQWILNFLWLFNKRQAKETGIPTAHFFGILFSGRMDEKRVSKILPKYKELAEKDGMDIEVLFHPGYFDKREPDLKEKHIVFERFYFSKNRKTEFDSVIKLTERGAL